MNSLNTIHIWDALELAKNDIHPYGGNIAELYALHFLPEKSNGDPWKHAGQNLRNLLVAFCHYHNVSVTVNGKPIGDWMDGFKFIHKCDVKVLKNESEKSSGNGHRRKVPKDRYGYSTEREESEKILYNTQNPQGRRIITMESAESEELIGKLEECKVEKPKKSIGKQLPNLLKKLWQTMFSRQSKRVAL